jgi:hypothetical protein
VVASHASCAHPIRARHLLATFANPCAELGGFLVDIFVKSIEPAPIVLLRGEVPLELDEPLETVAEWIRPPTPPPIQRPPSPTPESRPDTPIPEPPKGFVAFSGKGYRLSD